MNARFLWLYYRYARDWYDRRRNREPWRNRGAGQVSNVNYLLMTRLCLSKFLVRWWYQVHLLVFPIAIVAVAGPLFGAIVARAVVSEVRAHHHSSLRSLTRRTPDTSQQAWNHRCDSFPVEVVLDGLAYKSPESQVPLASFYFWENGVRTKYYEYTLSQDDAVSNLWRFNLRNVESHVPVAVYPLVLSVSYQLVNDTVSAHCVTGPEGAAGECMRGTFDPGRRLTFSLSDTRLPTNKTTRLRAVDDDWLFYKGSPRFILREVPLDYPNGLGDIIVQTVVTRPGLCTSLKVCLARGVGLETITPLGLALLKQNNPADKCTKKSTIEYYHDYYYYYD
jgi:hypothetical protein